MTGAGDFFRSCLRQHLPILALVAMYVGAGQVLSGTTGVQLGLDTPLRDVLAAIATGATATLITLSGFVVVFLGSRLLGAGQRTGSQWVDYRQNLTAERLSGIFVVWALLYLLLQQFLIFKRAIPALHHFAWDARLMEIDGLIHLGHQPWELLQPILGRPFITRGLDSVYYAWFAVNGVFFHWMGWRRWDRLRARFFLSYFLAWILLGTVIATIFSSSGPVYYALVVGREGGFEGLLAYLDAVGEASPLMSLEVQQLLWAGYTGQLSAPVEGIAAMPSMHVAIPVLLTIVGFRLRTSLGTGLAVYTGLILLGSVHLAWHYAVDGYVSVILVPLLWAFSGLLTRPLSDLSGF